MVNSKSTERSFKRAASLAIMVALMSLNALTAWADHKVDVIIDDQPIFQVSNSSILEAEERAKVIALRVQKLLSSGRPIEAPRVINDVDDEWQIASGDTVLTTVTEHDSIEFQTPPEQLARNWRDALDKAMSNLREQRREPISIDGRKLFSIGDTAQAKAFERAAIVNQRLKDIIDQRLDLAVKGVLFENLHVIQAGDQKLLTVTEEDAAHNHMTTEALTREWAAAIQTGIEQSKEQRTTKYLTQVVIKSVLAGFALAAALFFLRWLRRLVCEGLAGIRDRRKRSHLESGSLALIDLLLRWTFKAARILAILVTAYYILQLPPYTRPYVDTTMHGVEKAADAVSRAFVAELFRLGKTSVSIKSVFIVIVFVAVILLIAGVVRRSLEEKLFPQTAMDRGLQHSIATVISYVVIIIGFAVGLQSTGIDLSAFAVIAGAVGIGIGFGLQNIANNIISGLIILFERPIQVGDRVEVGNIAGDVVRINARSTTILTNDNIAIIVPNANFITATVINWSHLGDRRVRFRIKVGIAYNSDIKLVRQAMLEAAAEHQDILKDPPPSVRFMRFGESALEFELRVWTSRLSNRPGQVTSDMNFSILEKLKKYGIEIPKPQSELHIRSMIPVELRVDNIGGLLNERTAEDEILKDLK